MKKESRILLIYCVPEKSIYIFSIFRGSQGLEHMKIIRRENLSQALKEFSREKVFEEIRYVLVDEELSNCKENVLTKDLFVKNGLKIVSKKDLSKDLFLLREVFGLVVELMGGVVSCWGDKGCVGV
jgi:hypothetical protein